MTVTHAIRQANPAETGRARPWSFVTAVVVVGVTSGLTGIALTLLLHTVQHLAFGYTENTFLVGVEAASDTRRVLAVTVGGLLVSIGWWRHRSRFGADAVSVTRALRERGTGLPLVATVLDAALQVVAVGAGASLGREGAPRQTAAALAAWVSDRLRLDGADRRVLIACGAGAGLAAVYDVPVAGALFTLEVLLVSRASRDVIAALVTAAIATVVTWPVLSDRPAYLVSRLSFSWAVLAWAVLCAPLACLVGIGFRRYATVMRRHAPTGWLIVPVMTLGFGGLGLLGTAYPQLLGNGKGPAELAFTGAAGLGLVLTLLILKPLVTGGCLAVGAIGGLLTPALATGACLGAAAGQIGIQLGLAVSPGACALVGAAAVLAVTQRALFTAMVFPVEVVHTGLTLAAPIVVASVGAIVLARTMDRTTSRAT